MNFTSLKYFLVTAEELSITRAASKLYISQQALSSHILKLERELGVVLFDRYPEFRERDWVWQLQRTLST